MKLKQTAVAGTLESSDVMITISPGDGEQIEIELDSPVEMQFGKEIRRVIETTLKDLGIVSARVSAVDKGALDCVIRARIETAVFRSCGEKSFSWGGGNECGN